MSSKQIRWRLGMLLFVMLFTPTLPAQGEESRTPLAIDWECLQGDWQRSDGSYMIRVEDINNSDPIEVLYFNPNPVHVAEALTFFEGGLKGLFVKLEATRYQGSTYTLYYDNKQDALVGFYYHGQLQQRFEVVFLRRRY